MLREPGAGQLGDALQGSRLFEQVRGAGNDLQVLFGPEYVEGLLIQPAPSIHTFFMRFPIDVVFVAKNGEVMKVAPNVGAWRMRSCRRAFAVLELAAGEAERRGITVGDRIDKAGAT